MHGACKDWKEGEIMSNIFDPENSHKYVTGPFEEGLIRFNYMECFAGKGKDKRIYA